VRRSPLVTNELGEYATQCELNSWVKNINHSKVYSLHRICSSFEPSAASIVALVSEFGLETLEFPNAIGITPLHYLAENPSIAIDKKALVNRYNNAQSIKRTDDNEGICEQNRINRFIMDKMGMK